MTDPFAPNRGEEVFSLQANEIGIGETDTELVIALGRDEGMSVAMFLNRDSFIDFLGRLTSAAREKGWLK
jgi:hypothetical protein